MERVKNYFASANTGDGFVCHFDSIQNKNKPYFQFIIKGGSGTGKSTLMKKVGEYFEARGEEVEYFYCSTDTNSLDGVRFVSKNISIIDATAPHVFDARLPGVVDKIFDVGVYIKPTIRKHRESILENSQKKAECFQNAYDCLRAAKILDGINDIHARIEIDNSRINKTKNRILKNVPQKKQKEVQKARHLFLSAFSSEGLVNITQKNAYEKIIKFECLKSEVHLILQDVANEFENTEIKVFHDILNPHKITALEIENTLIIPKIIEKSNKKIEKNNILIEKILNNEKYYFSEAKKYHKKIENAYIKNMDFLGLDNATNKLIEEIEKM